MISMHELWCNRHRMTEEDLKQSLHRTAQGMYDDGWTVIGSRFKTPNLRPWKDTPRELLLQWCHEDIDSGRCNSLNLRLADSNVMALDCDFPDNTITNKLIRELAGSYLMRDFWTVCGAKGCKIFFRAKGHLNKMPTVLGPIAYTKGHAGEAAYKHMLELKTTVATVFGRYPVDDDKIYNEYQGTKFIVMAKPEDLPELDVKELQHIAAAYRGIVADEFVDPLGGPLVFKADYNRACAVLAKYMMMLNANYGTIYLSDFLFFMGDRPIVLALRVFTGDADETTILPPPLMEAVNKITYMCGCGDTKGLQALSETFESYYASGIDAVKCRLTAEGINYDGSNWYDAFVKYHMLCLQRQGVFDAA